MAHMTIYTPPRVETADQVVLEMINRQRDRLKVFTQTTPKRWHGSLRRSTLARAIQGSNSIEGIHARLGDVIAVVANEGPDSDREFGNWAEIKGYRDAMTYIMQAASDPYFEFSKQFLKSLQFMMVGHDLTKSPGQWRPGSIFIVNQQTGKTVYEGPDAEIVNDLVEELVSYLQSPIKEPVIVRAAMAHLNLTMIHPFKDGNGRVSRALQTLVLARDGVLHPVFSSIEEWLGEHSQEYYSVLAEVGQGRWNPHQDALAWVRFCFRAQYNQAATLIRRNQEYEKLYDGITALIERERVHERTSLALFDTALGFPMTRGIYRVENDVSEIVASRDLKRLCEAGLLVPVGEKRGRTYKASEELRALRESVRIKQPHADPYDLARDDDRIFTEPRFPGV